MDALTPLLVLFVLAAMSGGAGSSSSAPAAAAAPVGTTRDPAINPTGGVGAQTYGPAVEPQFTATTPGGLTVAYGTRDLWNRPIPVGALPTYRLDPQTVTTPITDALGAFVGWLIPVAVPTGSGWGTIDPGAGNVAV